MRLSLFLFFSFLMLASCQSESRANPRTWIEGTVQAAGGDYENINLSVHTEDGITAETHPDSEGRFTISGPVTGADYFLQSNKKIRSFSAERAGLHLLGDSLQIKIPGSVSYLKFTEIKLQP